MTGLPPAWAAALHVRRPGLEAGGSDACLRLLHAEDPEVRCDRFGEVCWFYRYTDRSPDAAAVAACDALTAAVGARAWHGHAMHDRGRDPRRRRHWSSAGAPASWTAAEAGLSYRLRADCGQSPGLFLDQRRNRAWVRQHAAGARILNLFAYTGAFGLAALAGGAVEVTQVDVSTTYLAWARANAAANGWAEGPVDYAAVEARLFVQGCRRRRRRFDGVVCDPPSFARRAGRGGRRRPLFRVARHLPDLVGACLDLLEPGGWVLVSSNYEGWRVEDFEAVVGPAAAGARLVSAPGPGPDFAPGRGAPALHSCILHR